MWDAVTKTHSKKGMLLGSLNNHSQYQPTDQSVTADYNNLMILWPELSFLVYFEMIVPKDAATTAEMLKWDQMFDFLAGLQLD